MIKALAKYLLSLCILLLSGYAQLSSPIRDINVIGSHTRSFVVSSRSSEPKESRTKIYARVNEVEEEELVSSKKHSEINDYTTVVSFSHVSEYLFHYTKNSLFSYKRTPYFSSFRSLFITLNVIRI